jgi:zinc transport system ATP-binding protein
MKSVLKVKNVTLSVDNNVEILQNVSFEVKKGELISLIGLNGSGKTTLLKVIVGLIEPSSGVIDKGDSKIFYIPQKSDLNISFPLSVKEFCKLYGEENYMEYIKKLELEKFLDKKVAALSGGEFQKVQIAIALSRQPDLLLLDEVTAGVDLHGEEKFYDLVLEIKEKYQIAVIVVSHNIRLVMKNADQVLCLAGHLCCSGKPEEVEEELVFKEAFGKYLHPYIHKHDHTH